MKHYAKKGMKFIESLRKHGFTVLEKKNKYMIFKKNGPIYMAHVGGHAFHPIRRFVKREYGVDVEE